MNQNSKIGKIYAAEPGSQLQLKNAVGIELPIVGGQVSAPDNTYQTLTTINGTSHIETRPDFELEYLPILEVLAGINGDVGFAINNIVNLANTELHIDFGPGVPETKQKKWTAIIDRAEKRWYMLSEPRRSLIRDLLVQIAINGVLSAEMVPKEDLSGLEKIVRVWPYSIRIAQDKETGQIMPYQRPRNWLWANNIQSGGFIKLNPVTYRYSALTRNGNTYYGTPPLLSVLEPLTIQRDMINSLKLAMKKMGLFGALSVLLTPLEKKQGEQEDQYVARNSAYMQKQMPHVLNFFNKGILAGFKGQHEINFQGAPGENKGIAEVKALVDQVLSSGLKTQPVFIGRTGTMTETLGRVLMEQEKSRVADYQGLVCSFMKDAYLMELLLAGEQCEYLECTMDKPTLGDRVKEANARKLETDTVLRHRDEGLIDQETAARMLGYKSAAFPGPVRESSPSGTNPAGDTGGDNKGTDPEKDVSASAIAYLAKEPDQVIEELMQALGSEYPVFDYTVPEGCQPVSLATGQYASKYDEFLNSYGSKISKIFKSATSSVAEKVKKLLKDMPETSTMNQVRQAVLYTLYSNWPKVFNEKTTPVINQQIESIYNFYRADQSVFNSSLKERPTVSLDLFDYRAITLAKKIDNLYLGKFVTDPDTVNRLRKAIETNFLEEAKPIGRNSKAISNLTGAFSDTLLNEEFKMRRVVDTTVNRLRNAGNLAYMNQAEVETYEIVEVMDQLTCEYCKHMNGKTFSVPASFNRMMDDFKLAPAEFVKERPFATSLKIDDFKALSDEELGKQFGVPPYHCHCRGRQVMA